MAVHRKVLKAIASVGSSFLVGSPIFIPAALAVQKAAAGDVAGAPNKFVYEAAGYDLTSGLDHNKLTQVITRDIVLVGIGFGLRWVGKRV